MNDRLNPKIGRRAVLHVLAIGAATAAASSYASAADGKDAAGKPLLVARQTFVTTGATRGDQVAILKGVKEGDTVVTGGQMKLRNGSPLAINNAVKPADDPNPSPVDH